jgi:hypothetical protein
VGRHIGHLPSQLGKQCHERFLPTDTMVKTASWRCAGKIDTGTVITVVPVPGAGGRPAPREAFQRIRQPSPLALFCFIHLPNCSRPLLRPYFERTL